MKVKINPWNLPKVCINEKHLLPESAGVYFALLDNRVLYIGMTINFKQRWVAHHRFKQLSDLPKSGQSVVIAFLEVDFQDLANLESNLIKQFSPELNLTLVPGSEKSMYSRGSNPNTRSAVIESNKRRKTNRLQNELNSLAPSNVDEVFAKSALLPKVFSYLQGLDGDNRAAELAEELHTLLVEQAYQESVAEGVIKVGDSYIV